MTVGGGAPRFPILEWVLLDYGEVISRRSTAFPWLAARLGADEQAFSDAYRRERDAYVLGSSDLAYWHAVGERLGREVDEGLARELTDADIQA